MESEKLTQTQRVKEALVFHASDITAEDRSEIIAITKLTAPTVSKYLSGKVANVDTGINVLKACKTIIEKRESKLASL